MQRAVNWNDDFSFPCGTNVWNKNRSIYSIAMLEGDKHGCVARRKENINKNVVRKSYGSVEHRERTDDISSFVVVHSHKLCTVAHIRFSSLFISIHLSSAIGGKNGTYRLLPYRNKLLTLILIEQFELFSLFSSWQIPFLSFVPNDSETRTFLFINRCSLLIVLITGFISVKTSV